MRAVERGIAHILVLIIVLIGIVVGVYLATHPQVFRPHAATGTRIEFVDSSGNIISQTPSQNVKLRLTYVPPGQATDTFSLIKKVFAANCNPSGGIDPHTWTLIEAYTCDPGNPGAAGQEWACFGNDGLPKAIKFSQDVSDPGRCGGGPAPTITPTPTPTSTPNNACLPGCCGGTNNVCGSCPNGQACRISNGACTSGLSCDPNSSNVTPLPSSGGSTEYGMQIDIRDSRKVPTQAQVSALNPRWFRFVFPCTNSLGNQNSCPADYHSTNLISSLPSGVKNLAVVTNDTSWNTPIGSSDTNTWNNYVNNVYLPTIRQVIANYGSKINAIELWNEEDLNDGPSYDPYVPPSSFAYLVSTSAQTIKNLNPTIKVVVGGLASGNNTYIHQVYQANPNFAQNVDAIGVHPYQPPPTVNQVSVVVNDLRNELNTDGINKPIWVTEIGIEEFNNSTYPTNQKDFLGDVFNQFQAISSVPPMVNWYAFSDLMAGVGGGINWGLVDGNGNVKDVGQAFNSYSSASGNTTPTPTPVAFPTSFRVANDSNSLNSAPEQVFDQNGKVIDWTLTPGNGIKTVYAQFKVNGNWQSVLSASINLQIPTNPTPTPNACLPGCCGGTNNMCGSCPNGQICRISNGACSSGFSCDPTTGVQPTSTPIPTMTPTPTPTVTPTPVSNACLPGCCGGSNNLCGSCPNGQMCRISNGACTSGTSCDPNTGFNSSAAQSQSCAQCVINVRPDLLPFYKSNGWDTSSSNYVNIVNNWCGIDPSSCHSVKGGPNCSSVCQSQQ